MKLELKKKLIADVRDKFGANSDPGKVIEYLYEQGTLDDVLAEGHMIKVDLFHRLMNTDLVKVQIEQDLAEDYGCSRQFVNHLANKSCAARG
jgi:hypothetical protein